MNLKGCSAFMEGSSESTRTGEEQRIILAAAFNTIRDGVSYEGVIKMKGDTEYRGRVE
jgi:hypothetical protein